ncbi:MULTISPECIES: DUF4336 domain-containing protein [unclassified Tolypothrix]|uniref:DUF4336 domain-containing protein n=1 Tax=unclassified Tolypothrix TaxID=2649714 RepID=UPI0005EAC40B|nr:MULTISPECIES: DUF4336 domain-containing protein [unclassified Tolypothrix]BAY92113.1 hypothetical protein NIES3275_41450 [Microchaete diplosiphon NIES-3275]EKF04671.1 hypothetical protein FDUTEX481_00828 [Tolypothrix sp. PCC 7601]MBE9084390.1 DUF4336 domain-containing protein [Tolypothrix sp. LEGE 11397]UYD26095.1 DUF4336 domain-containing protein [Tolypothrix sp. PCC 7712]UYD31666.1 DUF4336 domain-containing protein [Tolypothrix sp. PCC 7601]
MLKAIDTDIWVAEQSLKYFGLEVGTRMTVIRLSSNKLMVISPIKIDHSTINDLNQLGEVIYIVVPNLYHHLFVADFQLYYPHAKLLAVSGLGSKRPDLQIDKIISNQSISVIDEVEYVLVEGFNTVDINGYSPLNECVFFHARSQTLIVTDIVFHFDEQFPLRTKLIAKMFGNYKQLRPSLLEKLATQDKIKVKRSIQQLLTWDFQRIIMAHGSIIEQNAKPQLKAGYEWFLEITL